VTEIGSCAFERCTSLTSVIYYGTQDPGYGADFFFDSNQNLKIIVPDTYQNDTFCSKNVYRTMVIRTFGDNLAWELNRDSGDLDVYGRGSFDDYNLGESPWYDYRDDIKRVIIEDGISHIGIFIL